MWSVTRALRLLEAEAPALATTYIWKRGGHKIRGVDPEKGHTIEDRLAKWRSQGVPLKAPPTNIGLPTRKYVRSKEVIERIRHVRSQKKNEELVKLARSHQLLVDLEQVEKDWQTYNGPFQIKKIADHYNIFEDLYKEGYFFPMVPLKILFNLNEEYQSPVYYGNTIKPREATEPPDVQYEAADDTLWTLMLTNLDGNLRNNRREYVHWCVANIPGSNLQKGNTLVDYLQPIPPKGTGFHRYVFVLYKQEKEIDYQKIKVSANDLLPKRSFSTRNWYKKYQDLITPAGLAFFQSDWDYTLTDFYHNILNMKEPIFEYDFEPPKLRKQEWFPIKKPFEIYLDKYRNPKDVLKDYLLLKMKKEHPFKKPDPPPLYPNAHPYPKNLPSWRNFQDKKNRNSWGRINDV